MSAPIAACAVAIRAARSSRSATPSARTFSARMESGKLGSARSRHAGDDRSKLHAEQKEHETVEGEQHHGPHLPCVRSRRGVEMSRVVHAGIKPCADDSEDAADAQSFRGEIRCIGGE